MHETAPRSKSMRRMALIATLATLALAPSALAVAPTGSVSFEPGPPDRPSVGEEVTFTVSDLDWGGDAGTVSWSFGDGSPNETDLPVTHTYTSAGPRSVAAVMTNGAGESAIAGPVTVQVNAPPVAIFSGFRPLVPTFGQDVQFGSDSFDPDSTFTHHWNFGDGVTSELRNPVHPYEDPGIRTVTLTVTDEYGASSTAPPQDVTVQGPLVAGPGVNLAPITNFAYGPRRPRVGDPVEFASSAVDPEGNLRSQTWDINEDGRFDDARGEEVVHTFLSPGEKIVRLRAEDAAGLASIRQRTITVERAPVVPAGFLRPAPRIRFNGQILANGTRVNILGIRAPRGTLVRVTCKGKGCPAKQRRKRIKKGPVRFRNYERFLRAGVRLAIYMRKSKTIGQYTRYQIRAGKLPIRVDRCLRPGKEKPTSCGF